MLLIIGLGNPGPKYASTRHNIGFMVVDRLVKDVTPASDSWQEDTAKKILFFKKNDLLFVKPQTYMNESGFAVKKVTNLYKIEPENLWALHDDIDLPLGKIRIRRGGGTAGHHGIESLIRELGSDMFVRFRLGVGRGKLEEKRGTDQYLHRRSVEKYVVSKFSTHEEGDVRKLIKHAARAVETALNKGIDSAMNHYN